jgi:hypothetical protein
VDLGSERIRVDLTKEQIENSPGVDAAKTVSRQHEVALAEYYAWPPYWLGPLQPLYGSPQMVLEREQGDPHLRSAAELRSYHVHADDGDLGHIDDYAIDDHDWQIRSLILDTGYWLPGRKVPIPLTAVRHINWEDSRVYVNLTRDEIRSTPDERG